jgi:NAD(P) transhydrogenase subunit beta
VWISYWKHFISLEVWLRTSNLNGNLKKDIRLPFYNIINTLLIFGIVGLTICLAGNHIAEPEHFKMWTYILLGGSSLYGILFVLPIGGADMPVVISLLNSFTGMAAMFGGFLYDNMAMLTGGYFSGFSGNNSYSCHVQSHEQITN